ncbi:MAG: hypothetical protein M0Z31_01465 [Clostridia bacterium]|nr:hypothetical protein [Clostridia bacterium]
MTVGTVGNSALNTLNSLSWPEKLVEIFQRLGTDNNQREFFELIKCGQAAGLIRKDVEAELMSGILWEIKNFSHTQFLPQDLIINIIDVLFKGLYGEVNEGEDN